MTFNEEKISEAMYRTFPKEQIELFEKTIGKDLFYFVDRDLLFIGIFSLSIIKLDNYLVMKGMPVGTSIQDYLIKQYGDDTALMIKEMFCDAYGFIK